MKRTAIALTVLGLLLSPALSYARHRNGYGNDAATLAACPVVGDTKSPRVQALNRLKRRMSAPATADLDSTVTLAAMQAPGDDIGRFDTNKGSTVVGYVMDVKVGGVESVNCHTHEPRYRDTHIELVLDPMHDDERKHVIVEVTPQWRAVMADKHMDWSTPALRARLLGKWIKVTGWLLFDEEHSNASTNTAQGTAHVWRATAWEIHPITAIEVLPRSPQSRK